MWVAPWAALGVAGYRYTWTAAPFDQPGVFGTWDLLARLTVSVR
jgi:hypothetical protein